VTDTPNPDLCPPCAARTGRTALYRPGYTTCPACHDEWRHSRWANPGARLASIRARLADARRRRARLVAADVAILELQDREHAAGITWETDEWYRLHDEQAALARVSPWWERFGVWHQAYGRHAGITGGEALAAVLAVLGLLLLAAWFGTLEPLLIIGGGCVLVYAAWAGLRRWAGADRDPS